MPASKPPRHPRRFPQHSRDLKAMETPMPMPALPVRRPRGKLALAGAGVAVGGALASTAYSRSIAHDVGKGLVSIPLSQTSRGGAAGLKKLKGAAQEAAQSQWKRGLSKADCDVMHGTNVRRLTPRHPSGRFVSHENDLMVIHPKFKTDGRRAPRDSKLQCWGKGKDKASRAYVGKAEASPLAQAFAAGGASHGRRLPSAARHNATDAAHCALS